MPSSLVAVTHNGSDISDKVLSYTRNVEMCSGVGILDIVVYDDATVFEPWDIILLYEEGIKVGTFYIHTIKTDYASGARVIGCQDGSKKLQDYFIFDTETTVEGDKTKEWISHFITMAGVDIAYREGTGTGVPLAPETSMGMTSVFDQVTQLLQYSGWYMYFNEEGTCVVGPMKPTGGKKIVLQDNIVTTINIETDDKMLRNRALILGAGLSGETIEVEITVHLPWNYDLFDIRTVVMANSYIYSEEIAKELANMLIEEFAELTIKKSVTLAGSINPHIGDLCNIESRHYKANQCIVTTVESAFSGKDGLTNSLILDEKCPRLFSFWSKPDSNPDQPPIAVYTGHWGDGVYKKYIVPSGSSWEDSYPGTSIFHDFSEGLDNKYIRDLEVTQQVGAVVAEDGYVYTRQTELLGSGENDLWMKVDHGESFTGNNGTVYSGEFIKAKAVALGKDTIGKRYVLAGYNYFDPNTTHEVISGMDITDAAAWIARIDPDPEINAITEIEQVTISGGIYNVNITDVAVNSPNVDLITISGGLVPASGVIDYTGHRENQRWNSWWNSSPDRHIINTGIAVGGWDATQAVIDKHISVENMYLTSDLIVDKYNAGIAYAFILASDTNYYLLRMGLSTMDLEYLPTGIIPPWSVDFLYIKQIGTNLIDLICMNKYPGNPVYDLMVYRYNTDAELVVDSFSSTTRGETMIDGEFIDIDWTTFSAPILSEYGGPVEGGWKESCEYLGNVHLTNSNGMPILAKIWAVYKSYYTNTFIIYHYYHIHSVRIVATTTSAPTYGITLGTFDKTGSGFEYDKYADIEVREFEDMGYFCDAAGYVDYMAVFDLIIAYSKPVKTVGMSIHHALSNVSFRESEWEDTLYKYYERSQPFYGVGAGYLGPHGRAIRGYANKFYADPVGSSNIQYDLMDENFNILSTWDSETLTKGLLMQTSDLDGSLYYTEGSVLYGMDANFVVDRSVDFGVSMDGAFLLGYNVGTITGIFDYDLKIFPSGEWTLQPDYIYLEPRVLKHTLSGEDSSSEFITLLELENNARLDKRGLTPIATYDVPSGFGINCVALNFNEQAEIDGWRTVDPGMPIYDLRSYSTYNPANFQPASGEMVDEYRWAAVGTPDSIKAFPMSPDFAETAEPIVVAYFDKEVMHVETSSKPWTAYSGLSADETSTHPFFFSSLVEPGLQIGSGAGGGSPSGIFWQRLPGEESFSEDSLGLPASQITIIRMDEQTYG